MRRRTRTTTRRKIDVLVVGSGGREHALVWKLAQSPRVRRVYCCPGNAGIAQHATCVPIAADDIDGLASFAQRRGIGLTVVGPEAALMAGIVDLFRAQGLCIFGPERAAALIEGSKQFAKQVMDSAGVPTARWKAFTDVDAALTHIRRCSGDLVIKADGLAAGKGVVVAASREQAEFAAREMLSGAAHGEAGRCIVIEQRLAGPEVSVMAFVDGTTVRVMPAARDHKRAFDGDRGPNTGGMGSYSPVPDVTSDELAHIERAIITPVVRELARRGTPYTGVLFAGLMLTADGPVVIEFNARFGDPETQAVLPLLRDDLAELLLACTDHTLHRRTPRWSRAAAVCVVAAHAAYPEAGAGGLPIRGLHDPTTHAPRTRRLVFHAGTQRNTKGDVVTAGGRVLAATAVARSLHEARNDAYELLSGVSFDGMRFRTDIAWNREHHHEGAPA